MGTMICLAVGKLEVDWGKNNFFSDHGALFQASDLKPIPTYNEDEEDPEGEPVARMEPGFGKPLRHVRDRLELMGYTVRAVEHHYARLHRMHGMTDKPIPFATLRRALAKIDVTKVSGNYSEDYDPGEFVRKEIIKRLALASERHHYYLSGPRPDHWEVDLLLENFGASGALRLLAENPANLDLDVSWDYAPLVEAGWAEREEFQPGAAPDQQFLIVTEGSSDTKILQKALQLLRPHIADFFRFVDMEEGYPFAGTGNLYRFTQGLASIGILNNTVLLYDNDAEGVAKWRDTQKLTLPPNMRAMKLPDVKALKQVMAVGPSGRKRANINQRAASIECYLDLTQPGLPEPVVRWGPYNKSSESYQGELEHKTQFMKAFLNLRSADVSYDFSKIEAVLDAVVAECVAIAEYNFVASKGSRTEPWK
ncbi:HEPN/Toprim-associated domain-containing protein [Stenotrophomonas maltophilia]|uniref:HEPN/Toprim-associated domain-containing protein n=1 Tax=Stenotrophomonas maltophilia TaxID=40324 RepID=UPI0016607A1F|nr:HEPN/Toprim-associated domain-containing protein [Stenotrophomonas maltophilia]